MKIDLDSSFIQCDNCGTDYSLSINEKCPRCGMYHNEEPFEFNKTRETRLSLTDSELSKLIFKSF